MFDSKVQQRSAVILAAGFGSRLAGSVEETSLKPLTPVRGKPIIFRTIDSLIEVNHSPIIVVLGHKNDEIERSICDRYNSDAHIRFAYNQHYHLKNGVSLLAAEPYLEGIFTLTMADHLLGPRTVRLARNHTPPQNGATLLVDYKTESIFDMDDATKVLAKDNRIVSIGKELTSFNCVDTGVFVCSNAIVDVLKAEFRKQGDVSLSDGIQRLADAGKMRTLDIGEGFWQDVDTPEMLAYAETILHDQES